MVITYINNTDTLTVGQLHGFFVDWPQHPDADTHLKILRGSYAVWLALENDRCVGFINALSDGVFYAYIPLLEVLPECQRRGIGTELVKRMVNTLENMYAIDVVCDESVAAFYQRIGFHRLVGMIIRNPANQSVATMSPTFHPRAEE